MTEFTITESTLGSSPVVVVSGADGAVTASIALRGATLLSWVVTDAGEPIELVDGYATEQELLEQHGVRNGIMAPFTNRQRDGRYEFDGESHDLRAARRPTRTWCCTVSSASATSPSTRWRPERTPP